MRVVGPFSFSVTHSGRGGEIVGRCAAGTLALAIEMHPNGRFSTGLRGVQLRTAGDDKRRRLRPEERRIVFDRLRAWLDESGRRGWVIEPARPNELLSGETLRAIEAGFPRAYRSAVATHLCQYRGAEAERVRRDILTLADGDFETVVELVEAARTNSKSIDGIMR